VQPRLLRRSDIVSVPPIRYGWEEDQVSFASITEARDPSIYNKAIKADDSDKWAIAIKHKMEPLERNKKRDLVNLPKDSKAIGCRWVFRKNNEQYKARLTGKGYSQKESIDYNEIFSPVIKHTSIRLLLAIMAQGDLELEQLDMKTVFLYSKL